MPDTVIDRVNPLGTYKQELLLFTDRKGWLVKDGDVKLIVVYGGGDENEAPLKLKIKMILNIKIIKRSSIPSSSTKPFNNLSK